ncbi:MAG: DUF1345 domain-containing protein [Alphaproteobacteria bacterium]
MTKRIIKKLQFLHAGVRPRLIVAVLFAAVFFFLLPESGRMTTKFLLTWDMGVIVYLALVTIMMIRSNNVTIRKRAAAQDEKGIMILGLSVFGAAASLAAIMLELVAAKNLSGDVKGEAIGLAALTVLLSWVFMQTMFALHYAHAFYNPDSGNKDGGLEFPAKYTTPDYWDFVYFSFIIGTAAQTADINITSKVIRRIVTVQCVTVFFFNTTILALAINVGAGLA